MLQSNQDIIGRFAPSPTGRIHAGNIFSMLVCWLLVKLQNGHIVLRIEDLDPARSKPEYSKQLISDLESLGLTWDFGPYYQSTRAETYKSAFEELHHKGLVYPCFCTRNQLKESISSAPNASYIPTNNTSEVQQLLSIGSTIVYPGTCATLSSAEIKQLESTAIRDGHQASFRIKVPNQTYIFKDEIYGKVSQNLQFECGDFIICRSSGEFSYNLAVVLDDFEQGVNYVVRGVDLLASTPRQIYLQELLSLRTPKYAHTPLFVSKSGARLSKRDKSSNIDMMLETYKYPERIIGYIAYLAKILPYDEAISANELLNELSLEKLKNVLSKYSIIEYS